jgi:hypothetical protein
MESKTGAKIPIEVTNSFNNFLLEMDSNGLFLTLISISEKYLRENIDDARLILLNLLKNNLEEDHLKKLNISYERLNDDFFSFASYEGYFCQMAFARSIDNVITYFKDVLSEILVKRPEILKSSKETERLDFIFSYSNYDDLKKAIIDKKISDLFYGGINDIEKYFDDRLGIKLFEDDEDKYFFSMFVEQRNLIVHNRGRITKEFLKKFKDFEALPGEYFLIRFNDLLELNTGLNNFLAYLDSNLASKYNLDLINRLDHGVK